MEKYDIYWVKFYYEEDQSKFKIRPALILEGHVFAPLVSKITSHKPRTRFDYQLKDWKYEGLDHPGTVSPNKFQHTQPIMKIGHLSERDIEAIEDILAKEGLK